MWDHSLDTQINIKKITFFPPTLRMRGKKINFEDKEIKKKRFLQKQKNIHERWNWSWYKTSVSKNKPYGTNKSVKYFIGYNDDDAIRALCIKLPQMTGYVKCFDGNKTRSFKVIHEKLLKNYTKIWEKVSNLVDLKFSSEPVYGDNGKYIKTKIKTYRDNVNTSFQFKKVPKENSSYKCLSLIKPDSVIKASKRYYPQTF